MISSMARYSTVSGQVLESGSADSHLVICINPPDEDGIAYSPWRLRNAPNAIPPAAETEASEPAEAVSFVSAVSLQFKSYLTIQDSRLAEAVVTYQMKLLNAMTNVNDKLEKHNNPNEGEEEDEVKRDKPNKGKTGIQEVDALWKDLDLVDSGEKRLQREIEAVQREMLELTKKYKRATVGLSLYAGSR